MVIFDCDGVLIDSEVIASRIIHTFLHNWLHQISSPDHELLRNGALSQWLDSCHGQPLSLTLHQLEQTCNTTIPENLLQKLERIIEDELAEKVLPVPGMSELLRKLETPWAVASNSSPSRLNRTLGQAGLLPLCESRLFSAELIGRPKPAQDLHLHIVSQHQADPGDCLVVEDTPVGAKAGIAAGMTVFGFAAGSHMTPLQIQKLRDTGVSRILSDAHELRKALATATAK